MGHFDMSCSVIKDWAVGGPKKCLNWAHYFYIILSTIVGYQASLVLSSDKRLISSFILCLDFVFNMILSYLIFFIKDVVLDV